MPRYLCSNCSEVVEMSGFARFDWCNACGEPLTAEDRLPVHFGLASNSAPQPSIGPALGGADLAAPALATTTSPIAASSRAPRISPSTT
jgi:hypothetical protein